MHPNLYHTSILCILEHSLDTIHPLCHTNPPNSSDDNVLNSYLRNSSHSDNLWMDVYMTRTQKVSSYVIRILYLGHNKRNLVRLFPHIMLFDEKLLLVLKRINISNCKFKIFFSSIFIYVCDTLLHLTLHNRVKT